LIYIENMENILHRNLWLVLLLAIASSSLAQQNSFLRFVEGAGDWQGTLETSITSYENGAGQRVDLIAAIHIADTDYYDALNSYFDLLDIVLYELVADDNEVPAPSTDNSSLSGIGLLQSAVARFLDLEFQLNGIDYQKNNLVRADLSAQQLSEIMASKDESFFSMFLKMAMAQMAAEQNAIANQHIQPSTLTMMSLLTALSSDDQAGALKYLLAQELGRSGDLAMSPELESQLTILGDRNTVALKALEDALESGIEHAGLFYGAAHMAGMERELLQELGFSRVSTDWYVAWEIP